MAKSLEEHLYRSAKSKEDYLNMSTLKSRLQTIAQGLELHRSTSATSVSGRKSVDSQASSTAAHLQTAVEGFGNKSSAPTPPIVDQQSVAWSQVQEQPMTQQQGQYFQGIRSQQELYPGQDNAGNSGNQVSVLQDTDFMRDSRINSASSTQQENSQWNDQPYPNSTQQNAALGPMNDQFQKPQSLYEGLLNYSATPSQPSITEMGRPAQSIGMLNQPAQSLGELHQPAHNLDQLYPIEQSFGLMQQPAQSIGQLQQPAQSIGQLQQPSQFSGHLINNSIDNSQHASQYQQSSGSNAIHVGTDQVSNLEGGSSVANNTSDSNTSRFQGPSAPQKKKVILQQQQRLLLLRHASKCQAGAACPTKFCSQMVTLWRHMKTCRDKNCRTPHCLSSRCVLNHYRICKSNGKTATCEVCGPVMARIKQLENEDGSVDPLTNGQQEFGGHGSVTHQQLVSERMQQSLSSNFQQSQLHQLQNQQMQLQKRLENLQQLQKQQAQLQEQQKRLQEQAQSIKNSASPQIQQLHQQQMLLSELQKRCQQQQMLLQNELQEQTGGIGVAGSQVQLQFQQAPPQFPQQLQQFTGGQVPFQINQNVLTDSGMRQQAPMGLTQEAKALQQQVQAQALSTLTQQSQVLQIQAHAQTDAALSNSQGSKNEPEYMETMKRKRSRSAGVIQRGVKGSRGSGKGKGFAKLLSESPKLAKGKLSVSKNPAGVLKNPVGVLNQGQKIDVPIHHIQPIQERPPSVSEPASLEPVPSTSLVTAMTRQEIFSHLESLNKKIRLSSRTVTHKCMPIIQELIDDQFGWVFHDAVDPVALGLPDYFDVVKNPMHLELVKKKLENAIYSDTDSFKRDGRLVFENAILYNGENSEVGQLAQSMLTKLEILYSRLVQSKFFSRYIDTIKSPAFFLYDYLTNHIPRYRDFAKTL
jgi:hypothetical protein